MNFMYVTALLVLLFVITYNPAPVKSETYQKPAVGCCSNDVYRAREPTQCENAYYQGLQFGNPNYGCPPRVPKVCMGAIIGK